MANPFTSAHQDAYWSPNGPSYESTEPTGVIGPNSVTQLKAACDQIIGQSASIHLFRLAGLDEYLDAPPDEMIPEEHPAKLYRALYRTHSMDTADRVATLAGELTADYVIENRIPAFAAKLLCWLPAKLAGIGLLKAIQKNSWTFAGSGVCTTGIDGTPHVNIFDNPLRMPGAAWHRGVFEQMFRRLVCSHATVEFSEVGRTSTFDLHYGLPEIKSECSYAKGGNAPFMCANCTKSKTIH
jgi:divinyl protochlorophyllide a 8-vinyl-reductase